MTSAAELADRLAIQRNVGDYADALDLKHWDLLDQIFTPDARISFGGRSMSLSETKAWLKRGLDDPSVRGYLHMVGNLHITLRNGEADSIAHVFTPIEMMTDDGVRLGFNGLWFAWRHVLTAQGWRIAGSLDHWTRPDWAPGFYGWVTPPYSAAVDWSDPLPEMR